MKIAGNRRKERSHSLLLPRKRKTHSNVLVLKLSTNEEEQMGENKTEKRTQTLPQGVWPEFNTRRKLIP